MSTTIQNLPSDGINIAAGTASVANGGTVATGLPSADWFQADAAEADVSINMTSSSAGTATVSVVAAGVASGSAKTIYWKALSIKKI